uniref:TAFII55 protein conserved region domain-containing protein n=1 Tax=Araucaria cunninghamii TaxID=56994 RepID=A0A0D6R8B0_ARACU
MEEQFILRVPLSVAERINRVLSENAYSPDDNSIEVSFSDDGRNGTFVIGNDRFPASLLDLPGIVESHKSYDDSALIKTGDIGQMIVVREEGQAAAAGPENRDGLTPPMHDARRRRFRRRPDINPEVVSRVEEDLIRIMAGGTAQNVEVEVVEAEAEAEEVEIEAEAEAAAAASDDDREASMAGNRPPDKKEVAGSGNKKETDQDVEMKDQDGSESFDSDDD